MDISFRPIDQWPGALTRTRKRTPFDATYLQTLRLLERELAQLSAKRVVVMTAVRDQDFRLDGGLRSNARAPEHPGVIVAFDSKYGPLKYATDVYYNGVWNDNGEGWKENLRAIALALEALRKVDRYGITRRGEQYTGWKALPSGIAMPAANGVAFASLEDAAAFLVDQGEWGGERGDPDDLITDPKIRVAYYRSAALRLHPDTGADDGELFKRLSAAKRMLDEADA